MKKLSYLLVNEKSGKPSDAKEEIKIPLNKTKKINSKHSEEQFHLNDPIKVCHVIFHGLKGHMDTYDRCDLDDELYP